MPLTPIPEDGSGLPNANSYATVAEGDTFAEERPASYVTAWTGASAADQAASLVWATRLLDELVTWYGYKATQAQALQWPRYGVFDRGGYLLPSNMVPRDVKLACWEFARQLLIEDRTEDEVRGLRRIRVDVIDLTFDSSNPIRTLPDSVASLVYPYGVPKGYSVAVRVARG